MEGEGFRREEAGSGTAGAGGEGGWAARREWRMGLKRLTETRLSHVVGMMGSLVVLMVGLGRRCMGASRRLSSTLEAETGGMVDDC